MQLQKIKKTNTKDIFIQLEQTFNGTLKEVVCGEYVLIFNNALGNGTIKGVDFDWGTSFINFDVNFINDTTIGFENNGQKHVKFIFLSEGHLKFKNDKELGVAESIDCFQNVIISGKSNSEDVFVFPKETQIKANIIQLETRAYREKRNSNLNALDKNLSALFKTENEALSYYHFGNYNLRIADRVKKLNIIKNNDAIRSLFIEGQLNLIVAMQIDEHQNSQNDRPLPSSLSQNDLKKIQELSIYILNNLSEKSSITILSRLSGLGSKKLQIGFKLLYSKSVNEYVRDLKLIASSDYLKHSDLTVSEIVYTIGFKSRSYFSKIFFERYNILPKDYRTNVKTAKSIEH